MDGSKPTSKDILAALQSWIERDGIDEVFKTVGKVLCYSGPRTSINEYSGPNENISELINSSENNHGRAVRMVSTKEYTLIDTTYAGQRLMNYKDVGIYEFFNTHYGEELDENGNFLANKYAREVFLTASKLFIGQAKGDVETLVCGADQNGVFYTAEIASLMENKDVTSINAVPKAKFIEIYYSGDDEAHYQTFRKICQSQLALIRKRCLTASCDEEMVANKKEYLLSR